MAESYHFGLFNKYLYINMETEAVDLTDPLEELLHKTGWTPEYLQERLLKLTSNGVKKPESISHSTTSSTIKQTPASEVIELSDDEDNEPVKDYGVSQINVVKVTSMGNDNDNALLMKDEGKPLANQNGIRKIHVCPDIIQLISDSDSDDEQDPKQSELTHDSGAVITKENDDTSISNNEDMGLDIQVTNCTMEEFKNLVQRENSILDAKRDVDTHEININSSSDTISIDAEHESETMEESDIIIGGYAETTVPNTVDVNNTELELVEFNSEGKNSTANAENTSLGSNLDTPREDGGVSNDDNVKVNGLDVHTAIIREIVDEIIDNVCKHSYPNEKSCLRGNECTEKNDESKPEEGSYLNPTEMLDELRESLKLQLSTLRTRKKVHLVEEIKTKIVDVEYKKKSVVLEVASDESMGTADDVSSSEKPSDDPEMPKMDCESEQTKEEEHVSNVFNEIRKIINKKKSLTVKTPNAINEELSKQIRIHDETISAVVLEKFKPVPEISSLPAQETSSPFVSDRLDEFLTDSKLNVSYTIPKSFAEEGLCRKYAEETVIPTVVAEVKEDVDKPKRENKYKPKTLAEKRRLLERDKLKEKRRIEKLMKIEQKRSYVVYRDQKVLVKTNTPGRCVGYFESAKPKISEDGSRTGVKKPSLLTDFFRRNVRLTYKPGPLSRKPLLQNGCVEYSTEVRTMPRVMLNLMPEPGRPVHGNLVHLLPKWDGEITEEQTEFALSALVSKKDDAPMKVFSFEVPYENDEKHIMVRKRRSGGVSSVVRETPVPSSDSSSVEDVVKDVLERLIDYVEIKELSPGLIRETDTRQTKEESSDVSVPAMDNHVYVKRRQGKKRSKVDMELLRLNCKLVNVEVDDNEPELECSKEYCSMGCVCKSLQCEAMIGIHCRKINCIFGCTCPKEKDKCINISAPIKLPPGTNLLSKDTVNRIEDEAKRNLAKIEKEFTQTVIYTSNKAIVVGCGSKARRATKMPKKYSDFFDEDEIMEKPKPTEVPKPSELTRPCYVLLDKANFADVVPYCLAHHLYDCFCKGEETSLPIKEQAKTEPVKIEPETKPTKPSRAVAKKDETMEESFKNIVRKAALQQDYYTEDVADVQYSTSGRPLRKKRKVYGSDFLSDDLEKLPAFSEKPEPIKPQVRPPSGRIQAIKRARNDRNQQNKRKASDESVDEVKRKLQDQIQECFKTMEIPSGRADVASEDGSIHNMIEFVFDDSDSHQSAADEVTSRCSRTESFSGTPRTLPKGATICDFVNHLTDADLNFARENKDNHTLSDCARFKIDLIEAHLKEIEVSMVRKRKRKQEITPKANDVGESQITFDKIPIPDVKTAFEGEIIIRDSEMIKSLPGSLEITRILPWSALLKGMTHKKIGVYCITNIPFKLIFANDVKLKGRNVLNVETYGKEILQLSVKGKTSSIVKRTENVRDIIRWLLSGKLPEKYQDTGLAFLLLEVHPKYFEVGGICTQTNKDPLDKSEWIQPADVQEATGQITEVKHRDMNNKVESLFIIKNKFPLRELVEEGFDDDDTDSLYMWVGLPEVFRVAKWRVVFLKNDFVYLHFKTVNYSIKYTDLIRLGQMAKEEKHTLILRNTHISQSSVHNQFGVYISHCYTDRIFIGPYFIDDQNEDIETLRYINKALVSSESFNRMKGNVNYKCGHWMRERTYSHQPRHYIKDVLDVTSNDSLLLRPLGAGKGITTTECKQQNSQGPGDNAQKYPTISIRKNLFNSSKDGTASSSASCSGSTMSESLVLEVPPDMTVSQESITASISPSFEFATEEISNASSEQQVLYYNGFQINIKTAKPRSPSEFNRFVMTSIPGFGYLGAFQPYNSNRLEISWPFEKKVLQFGCAEHAKEFLRARFNQLLQPVPETFKIEVDILTELDITKHEPVNAKYLNGQCICGKFGIYNFKNLDDAFCKQKLNISKQEIIQLFAKKAHDYIKKKIQELAEIVGISESDRDGYNMNNILEKAKEEVQAQEKLNRNLCNVISQEEDALSKKLLKSYEMIKNMPKKYRNIESRIISDILRIRPRKLNANEVVEINDDDDVEFVSVTQLDENERLNKTSKASIYSNDNLKGIETNSNDAIKFPDIEFKNEPATSSNDALISFNTGQQENPDVAEVEMETDAYNSDSPLPVVELAPLPVIQDVRSLKTYSKKAPVSPVPKPVSVVKPVKLIKSPTGTFVFWNGKLSLILLHKPLNV
ncbi:hypothetical protein GWI33_002674 [Rhynchophorus ferrugineus]|uniref:MGA conserved domain-containing protein n=1 Tax=Rhynchophorus ferrugineus TaxID=354439 RepID=A0A834MFK3_RHYFE|nr:hypothetical protein GWI33_002674 [Rhynchophorus ferrugineus]